MTRYFSQLARETLARVTPRRDPVWLPPASPVLNEITQEWPVPSAPAPTRQFSETRGESVESTPPRSSLEQAATSAAPATPVVDRKDAHSHDRQPNIVRNRTVFETRIEHAVERKTAPADSAAAISAQHAAHPAVQQDRATQTPAPVERAEPAPPPRPAPTASLQDAIAEISRRQREFESRFETATDTAGNGRSPERADAPHRKEETREEISLSIGSIVVQTVPDTADAKPPAAPPPRRASRQRDYRWRRSFLDR